jgi:hypothetical protein
MRGDEIRVPGSIEVGDVTVREYVEIDVPITFLRSTTISGTTSDCNCIEVAQLPLTGDAGLQELVKVRIKAPKESGSFVRLLVFQSGVSNLRPHRVRLYGRAVSPR